MSSLILSILDYPSSTKRSHKSRDELPPGIIPLLIKLKFQPIYHDDDSNFPRFLVTGEENPFLRKVPVNRGDQTIENPISKVQVPRDCITREQPVRSILSSSSVSLEKKDRRETLDFT